MSDKKRVSDIISEEDIYSWKDGDVITIKAGTGAGKSYFIKNKLYDIAKKNGEKILMLIHRRNCVDQFRAEISKDGKSDIIDIATYQLLESKYLSGEGFDISKYDYIVADEFHFFLSDSVFNRFTDISLEQMLGDTGSIKIFMSATGVVMERYINNIEGFDSIGYSLPVDYDFIDNLYFFNKEETLEGILNDLLDRDEKAIVFIKSAKTAYKIHRKYKSSSLFNCSKGNREYYRYVDEEKIQRMLEEEGCEESFIFTTTTMDSGVNITDLKHEKVNSVILDISDPDVLIQSLGRRRIDYDDENDKIDVYIKDIKNRSLGGSIKNMREKNEKVEYFIEKGEVEYVDKYGRDPDTSGMIYEVNDESGVPEKKVNKLMYFKSVMDIANTQSMIQQGYKNYIANILDRGENYMEIEEIERQQSLEQYLESIVDERIFGVKNREVLIQKIGLRNINNRLVKTHAELAPHLEVLTNGRYQLIEKQSWEKEHRGKVFWMIIK